MQITRRRVLLALGLSSIAPVLSAREALPPAAGSSLNSETTNPGGFNMTTRTVEIQKGIQMPIYGIGTYSLHGDRCISSVLEALKNGVRLIDTAHIYGNEREVGEAVRRSGIPRDEIFVITKLYPNQYSDPKAAIDESLERLNIGTVDMVLLHHPGADDVKAYHALEEAVKAGRIRAIGLSNWYEKELNDFLPRVSITSPRSCRTRSIPTIRSRTWFPTFRSSASRFRPGIRWAAAATRRRSLRTRSSTRSGVRTGSPRRR